MHSEKQYHFLLSLYMIRKQVLTMAGVHRERDLSLLCGDHLSNDTPFPARSPFGEVI